MQQPFHPKVPKPIRRSRIRRALGRQYFILRRKWQWQFGGKKYARKRDLAALAVSVFAHQTPLLRRLKDVDMWLQHNKVTNLRLAIQRLDGLVIQPGETFSYWYSLGNPTKSKGYLPGLQLDQGRLKSATGGGLCQLSNLIFWISAHTPLTIVERWRHGFDVFPDASRTQPFGSGATCAWNYIDLQLKNESDQPMQLKLWLDEEFLHGEWRVQHALPVRYEVYESDHLFRQEYWGYTRHNLIARRVIDAHTDELISEEPLVENHAIMMYNPMLGETSG
jgi:vancomycin resistance protein VanW